MNTTGTAKKLAKSLFKESKYGPKISNLYTGKQMKTSAQLLGIAGVGLTAAAVARGGNPINGINSLGDPRNNKTNTLSSLRYNTTAKALPSSGISVAPMSLADGTMPTGMTEPVAQGQYTGHSFQNQNLADSVFDKTLGAQGSMVFGLHNRRHG